MAGDRQKLSKTLVEKLQATTPARCYYVVDGDLATVGDIKQILGSNINIYESITDAVGAATTKQGDIVYILPGSYTPTASIPVTKHNLRIVGLSGDGRGSDVSITGASTADEIFNVSADKVSFEGLRMNCYSTTKNGITIAESAVCFYTTIKNCTFRDGAVQVLANSILDAPNLRVENCFSYAPTTSFVDANASMAEVRNNVVDCMTTACTACIRMSNAGVVSSRDNMLVDNNIIMGNAVAAIGIQGGGGDNVVFSRNLCSECTDDLEGTYIPILNYDETSGGTLLT